MSSSAQFLNATEAARRLGVSVKALRLYEQRGLIVPVRNSVGWRIYGPAEMQRAGEIAAMRALGLSLAQIGRILDGGAQQLAPVLAEQQALLEARTQDLQDTVEKVRRLRRNLARDTASILPDWTRKAPPTGNPEVVLDLPWPWGGEEFALGVIRRLTYITGPLGSGKTRLAHAIAAALPGTAFVGLARLENENIRGTPQRLEAEPELKSRVITVLAQLGEAGATVSSALTALLVALESNADAFVVDMIEQGLDAVSQAALMAHLRHGRTDKRPILMLTRSNAILDLTAIGPDETIILCPANHSPPIEVAPYPGAPGYESVASCLASPQIRARTEGVIAWRPEVA